MEEDLTNLKLDYKFDLEDFIVIENIEHSYFPDDNITSAEEVMKWYKKNNLTCVGVRNADNKIIASVLWYGAINYDYINMETYLQRKTKRLLKMMDFIFRKA